MGNSSSNKRDRANSSDSECASPCREDKIFEFGGKSRKGKFLLQPSLEECEDVPDAFKDRAEDGRSRSTNLSSSTEELTEFPAVFKWDKGGKEVFISGTFSDWKPIRMAESHGDFNLILNIPEGEHEYKFQVDGRWLHNPDQPVIDNDLGSKNNIVSIKKCDFEVFEALALDISSRSSGAGSASFSSSFGSFSQEIPDRRREASVAPPSLPPHLLEVLLNKDVPPTNEPTLLPEPNHVIMNHLYALSIKEGVMVLSATLRFRKKSVTTVLYKPI